MKFNYTTYLIFNLIGFISYSQDRNNVYSNVELNPLQNKYLDVTSFRNGDPLEISFNDTITWKTLQSKKNTPAVFVSKKGEHFYNYFAISDRRGLCPYGFRVPSFDEIYSLNIDLINESNKTENSDLRIKIEPYGYLDNTNGSIILQNPTKSVFLGTIDKGNEQNYFFVAHLFKNKNTTTDKLEFPTNAGLPIRCLLNISEVIKDSVFDYKKLLPNEYKEFIISVFNDQRIKNKEGFTLTLSGEISSFTNGIISTNLLITSNESNKTSKKEVLGKKETALLAQPIYRGQFLNSSSDVNVEMKLISNEQQVTKFLSWDLLDNESDIDYDSLRYAWSNGFKYLPVVSEASITENGENIFIQKNKKVKKFQSSGLLPALGSILPGLGTGILIKDVNINLFEHNNIYVQNFKKRRKIRNGLLASSISLGLISIVSKVYSNYQYTFYKRDVFAPKAEDYYSRANAFQKVFLSSLGAYAVLGVIDFSICFKIGGENKKYERGLNKALRVENNGVIIMR